MAHFNKNGVKGEAGGLLLSRAPGERGFTLVELLIAMSILAVGLLGLGSLAATATRSAGHSQGVTQATNIAQDRVEALLTIDFDRVYLTDAAASELGLSRTCAKTDATASRPVYTCNPISPDDEYWLDGKRYTWFYTAAMIDLDGDGTANINRDQLLAIDVTVRWLDPMQHRQISLTMATMRGLE